jgi:hypothetical protein
MILLADVLAAEAASGPSWPMLVSTGATLAVLVAVLWQARELAALRHSVKQLQEPPPPPAPPASPGGRASKPMFAGLYAEKEPSALDGLIRVPGAPLLAIAGLLVLAALGLGLAGGSTTPGVNLASRAELDTLRATLDSVSGRVRLLGDSLQLVAAPAPRPAAVVARTTPERRVASRPTTIPAAPQILPAPSLPGTP